MSRDIKRYKESHRRKRNRDSDDELPNLQDFLPEEMKSWGWNNEKRRKEIEVLERSRGH